MFHVQQAPCIGMYQPSPTCAEAIQSNLVWDAFKHTFGPEGLVRVVYTGCNRTGRASEGQCTGTGKVVKDGQGSWMSPLILGAVMCICTAQAEAFK